MIDSIIRDWHIPPIHIVIEKESAKQLVLDGQQRLVSIRDFVAGKFPVDGRIEPLDEVVTRLDGLRYGDLPTDVRRRFDLFAIRVFRITDYQASEPGELFYRLNQPSALTAAEQRNAFFGDARRQVKELVSLMVGQGLDDKFWGFANSRMAYDDILARVLLILDNNSLRVRVTAASLADKYRSGASYSETSVRRVKSAIGFLSEASEFVKSLPKFNKATAQTWLVFISEAMDEFSGRLTPNLLGGFISDFSALKAGRNSDSHEKYRAWASHPMLTEASQTAFSVYEDRATSRVLDVSSVVLRDMAIWSLFARFTEYKGKHEFNSERICIAKEAFGGYFSDFQRDSSSLEWDL